jgi:hypothetical protein
MPIQIELIKENRVVLQTYSDPLDGPQLYELMNRMDHIILPAAEGQLQIIADFRAVKHFPGSFISLGARMLHARHQNTGKIVFVTANPLIMAMSEVVSGVIQRQLIAVVPSIEAADKLIDEQLKPMYSLID